MKRDLRFIYRHLLTLTTAALFMTAIPAQENKLIVDWNKVEHVSKTTATLQVVENPMVRPPSPIHQGTFKALKNLGADYVRYVPWFPYPKMAVAELKPPTKTETFWDFTYADSTMEAIMNATAGHSAVINFSTTPAWMWKTEKPVTYPEDAYQVWWDYNQGEVLRDETAKELAGYYARMLSWYTKGGFTDELGVFHQSNHHYNISYWEVLNEPDLEHNLSPKDYTKIYDAVVSEMKKVSPATKFIGISVAFESNPEYFEYFLNPKNHKAGVPLDGISYHFYGTPSFGGQKIQDLQYVFFEKANYFLDRVRYIENIRKRLSPNTITTINEIGTIINAKTGSDIPKGYWNLSGAMYAYLLLELTKLGIEVAGESQLVGYPSQYPDVSMMNWETAQPNPRYWVLKLLKDNFGPGDKLVSTSLSGSDVISQAFITATGKKILFINPRNSEVKIALPAEANGAGLAVTDISTGDNEATKSTLPAASLTLKPFAVAVVQLK
ncbi:MAG TPA: glycosyl hydrolase family 39 [Panacibacter sp.]|nr:glycosyl hydrolase family 39 [Panacibacter sp.]HNP45475.1 glycosyl hydrolase family 39 [Panacibacter sp.]